MERIKNISAIAAYENTLWFASEEFNALFRYDLENNKTEFAGSFPGEELKAQSLYSEVALYGHQIIFAPAFAGKIAIYDIAKERFVMLSLPETTSAMAIRCTERRFCAVVVKKHDAFFVGKGLPVILKLDLQTYKIQEYFIPGYSGKVEDCYNHNYFFIDKVVLDDSIFLPMGDKIFEWHMNDGSSVLHDIGEPGNRYITICHDGARLWLTGFHDEIYVWDMAGRHLDKLCRFPDGFKALHPTHNFIRSFYYNGAVYFIPGTFNRILKADISNYELSEVDWIENLEEKITLDKFQTNVLKLVGEINPYGLVVFSDLDETFMMIRGERVKTVSMTYPDDFPLERYRTNLSDVISRNGGCIPESDKWNLDYFLRKLLEQKGGESEGSSHEDCGAAIYHYLRRMGDHAQN